MDQTKKQAATKLRHTGRSYNEIHARLGVAKSTLSSWFKDLELSETAQSRLRSKVVAGTLKGLVQRNKEQTTIAIARAAAIRSSAKCQMQQISQHDLLLLGVALYWGEGYKKPKVKDGVERTWHSIAFTNADPSMILVFMKFLREVMNVDDKAIRLNLRLFDRRAEQDARAYWIGVTGLAATNFEKVTYYVSISSKGKRPYNQLPYGTIQVRLNDTQRFHQLMGWIEGVQEQVEKMPG